MKRARSKNCLTVLLVVVRLRFGIAFRFTLFVCVATSARRACKFDLDGHFLVSSHDHDVDRAAGSVFGQQFG